MRKIFKKVKKIIKKRPSPKPASKKRRILTALPVKRQVESFQKKSSQKLLTAEGWRRHLLAKENLV